MSTNKYKEMDKNNIKKGDEIYTLRYPSFGWHQCFRYPILVKHVVESVTPKRTKITTTKNTTILKDCAIYELTPELMADAKVASNFNFYVLNHTKIGVETLAHLSDKSVTKISNLLKEAIDVMQDDENYVRMQQMNEKH